MRISMNNPVAKRNVQFINLVKKYPLIYDHTHEHYINQDYTSKAWTEISKETDKPVHICKKKWTNFRLNYSRSVKNKEDYAYKSALSFLHPHLRSTIDSKTLPKFTGKEKIKILDDFYCNIKYDEKKFDELDQPSRVILLKKIRGMIKQVYKDDIDINKTK